MRCKRCGNTDPSYFYKGHKGYYCRKCIRFSRILLEVEILPVDYEIAQGSEVYRFDYPLTEPQLEASRNCVEFLKHGDVLLYCVCGAGKTEIAVQSISEYLRRGLKVAYAISRREVVIELTKRFEKIFSKAKVTGVYGGHHDELTGDMIVCTCHHLYRYYQTFDLLILDDFLLHTITDEREIKVLFEVMEKRSELSRCTIVCSQREPNSWASMILNDEVSANAILKRATKHYTVVIQPRN